MKLYVKRVFITDDAEILPHYLRFVRGLVDSADLPLSLSREMIQQSPILAAIKKSVTGRVLGELEKLADSDAGPTARSGTCSARCSRKASTRITSGATRCLKLARFRTTARRGAAEPQGLCRGAEAQPDRDLLHRRRRRRADRTSPHLEGFRARGIEVLLLADMVDSMWVSRPPSFDGKPFKSVTQGAADLAAIPLLDAKDEAGAGAADAVTQFIAFVKMTLGDAVSDVRASDRLTDSAVCLVASEHGPDRSLEKLLAGPGRLAGVEADPGDQSAPQLVVALAGLGDERGSFKEDAAHLLLDEARVLDGERPADPRSFSERLARVLEKSVRKG